MKKSPPPLQYSRYPPRKLLLFLLSNTHPAIGVMGKTTLINNTGADMEIREFRGPIDVGKENNFFNAIPLEAGQRKDIDRTENEREITHVMIFSDGRSLLSSSEKGSGQHYVWRGEIFFSKTVTIYHAEDQNSTGVVNYEVQFAKAKADPTKVFSDSFMNHDNGWTVQRFEKGIVKLTRKEGMTMTLDPSKLFASNIVPDPQTPLLNVVLKFWPRTFADLKCKDDLGTTIGIVKYLMRQAKVCHDNSEVEGPQVAQKVGELHKLCPAMVEWYRPLFPEEMKDQFPQVEETRAEVDLDQKLNKFGAAIKDILRKS